MATVPKTTTTSGPGTFGISARSSKMITSDDTPSAAATGLMAPRPRPNSTTCRKTPSAGALKPSSLGSWLTTTTTAMPFM